MVCRWSYSPAARPLRPPADEHGNKVPWNKNNMPQPVLQLQGEGVLTEPEDWRLKFSKATGVFRIPDNLVLVGQSTEVGWSTYHPLIFEP
jgi:hypothetical protein